MKRKKPTGKPKDPFERLLIALVLQAECPRCKLCPKCMDRILDVARAAVADLRQKKVRKRKDNDQ